MQRNIQSSRPQKYHFFSIYNFLLYFYFVKRKASIDPCRKLISPTIHYNDPKTSQTLSMPITYLPAHSKHKQLENTNIECTKKGSAPKRCAPLLKTISNKHYGLHTFGNFDTQQAHAQTDYLAHLARQGETEHLDVGILLAQDAEIVVELIVLLHQIVAVIGNA